MTLSQKGKAFHVAALAYCKIWTRDMRNARDLVRTSKALDQARQAMYDAYRDLEQEGRQEREQEGSQEGLKPGDQVVCIEADTSYARKGFLQEGAVYTVEALQDCGVILQGSPFRYAWNKRRFRKFLGFTDLPLYGRGSGLPCVRRGDGPREPSPEGEGR